MDFRKESYSETLQDFSAVVDTLGREKEGPQSLLMEAKGAAYLSLQPSILKVRKRMTAAVTVPENFSGVGIVFRRNKGRRMYVRYLMPAYCKTLAVYGELEVRLILASHWMSCLCLAVLFKAGVLLLVGLAFHQDASPVQKRTLEFRSSSDPRNSPASWSRRDTCLATAKSGVYVCMYAACVSFLFLTIDINRLSLRPSSRVTSWK